MRARARVCVFAPAGLCVHVRARARVRVVTRRQVERAGVGGRRVTVLLLTLFRGLTTVCGTEKHGSIYTSPPSSICPCGGVYCSRISCRGHFFMIIPAYIVFLYPLFGIISEYTLLPSIVCVVLGHGTVAEFS